MSLLIMWTGNFLKGLCRVIKVMKPWEISRQLLQVNIWVNKLNSNKIKVKSPIYCFIFWCCWGMIDDKCLVWKLYIIQVWGRKGSKGMQMVLRLRHWSAPAPAGRGGGHWTQTLAQKELNKFLWGDTSFIFHSDYGYDTFSNGREQNWLILYVGI